MIEWKGKPAFQTVVRVSPIARGRRRMLTESEEKYRLLADHMRDQVWIMGSGCKMDIHELVC